MKKFALFLLLLLPVSMFGQLFPKVPDFKGNIERIVEKRYGKEVFSSKRDSGVFKPGAFSGWKYTYHFDGNSKLTKQVNTLKGKVTTEYLYQSEETGNKLIKREITKNQTNNTEENRIEYENLTNSRGLIEKVNSWSVNKNSSTRDLLLFETETEYNNDKLTGFTRYYIAEKGDTTGGERFSLFYDSASQLIRIERKDIVLDLKTILYYDYNEQGDVNHFSIDYLVGLRNFDNNKKQDIYFKYDRHGNWVKRYYSVSDKKKVLEAKRSIKYR